MSNHLLPIPDKIETFYNEVEKTLDDEEVRCTGLYIASTKAMGCSSINCDECMFHLSYDHDTAGKFVSPIRNGDRDYDSGVWRLIVDFIHGKVGE
jgi:hypothetical protein